MRLYTAIVVRNEAAPDRYLRRVLERCQSFSDAVLVLDDRSTDNTANVARECGAIVRTRQAETPMWGAESSARRELWEFACEYATEPDDWVLIADADMLLEGDLRSLCQTTELNAWAFVLYDAWSETHYRSDGFWQGHTVPRVWCVAPKRTPKGWVPEWANRGVHVGHIPLNFPVIAGMSPSSIYWVHLGWAQAAHRQAKAAQYAAVSHQLTPFERAHAASILDEPA